MGISHRLKRVERQVRQLRGSDQQQARLVQQQHYQYQKLCEVLGCTPADLPYAKYLSVWRATTHMTFWLAQAAPNEALRWLAQHHCPVVRPVLERLLQRPRFVDPFWTLQHGLLPYRANANEYEHFLATLIDACHTIWPEIATAWLTLGYEAQVWLLQCWLCVSDPARCQWNETTIEEAKRAALKIVLTRLYEEYKDVVLHAKYHWHPGMCYLYKENPAYGLQPSGWGLEGQPLGGGKSTPPLDDTAAAWQRHCARQLTARWVTAATETARSLDQAALLAQAQVSGAPDETSSHSPGGRVDHAIRREMKTPTPHALP